VPDDVAAPAAFSWPFDVRFHEVDALGVVFNMWYLGYCDAAQAAFFAHLGSPSSGLNAEGLDVLLRHADVQWVGALGPHTSAVVRVHPVSVGNTSLVLRFEVVRVPDGQTVFTAQITYVCVRVAEREPVRVPEGLREALERRIA
jgi:acyl-CoA thioester hydrolase